MFSIFKSLVKVYALAIAGYIYPYSHTLLARTFIVRKLDGSEQTIDTSTWI